MNMGTDFKTDEFPTRLFIMKKNKTKKRKSKHFNDPFKELVMAISEKANLPESSKRGIVKGNDVSRMKDFLEKESKDARKLLYPINIDSIKKRYIKN